MKRILTLCSLLALVGSAGPAFAGAYWHPGAYCYWCIRDAIYADISLIDHLEAYPPLDDGIKGPPITAARADIHRLRRLLGPLVQAGTLPCCYTRKRIYIR